MNESAVDAMDRLLLDYFAQLVKQARAVKDEREGATPADGGLLIGQSTAYYEAIALLQRQLVAAGLSGRFPVIMAFDAERELL
jgi:hypothetical protein